MNSMNYIGLDIHKKSISCCVRQADGTIIQESTITATRHALDEWLRAAGQWRFIESLKYSCATHCQAMRNGCSGERSMATGSVVAVCRPAWRFQTAAWTPMLSNHAA